MTENVEKPEDANVVTDEALVDTSSMSRDEPAVAHDTPVSSKAVETVEPKTTGVEDASLVAGGSLGLRLRRAREAHSLTLSDAAQALKITQHQVEAMESGHYERLPGTAFVRGFLRNYARYLKIDIQDQMPDLGNETGVSKKQKNASTHVVHRLPVSEPVNLEWLGAGVPLVSSERRRKRFSLRKLFLLLFVALLVLLALAAYFDWFKSMGAAYIEKAEEAFNGNITLSADHNAVVITPPAITTAASQDALDETNNALQEASEASMGPSSAPLVGNDKSSDEILPGQISLKFHAARKSQISVRDRNGKVVFDDALEAGGQRVVNAMAPLELEISNAGAVSLEKNGKNKIALRRYTDKNGLAKLTVR